MRHRREWMWNLAFEMGPLFLLKSSLHRSFQPHLLPSLFPHCFSPFLLKVRPLYRTTQRCSHGVLASFLVFLVVRLAQPKDLRTGGWGKLWNLVVCTGLAEWVNIYQRSRCIVLQNGGRWYWRLRSWEAAEPGLQSACLTPQSLYHVVPSVTFELHLRWVGTVYGFLSRNLAVIAMWLASVVLEKN